MKRGIQGPGLFLAQFMQDAEPYNNIRNIVQWVASLDYKGIQVPSWDSRVFDLNTAANSIAYCDEFRGEIETAGLQIIELAAYLQGQIMAVHPAYETLFQTFYPSGLNDRERTEWATDQLMKTIKASARLGTKKYFCIIRRPCLALSLSLAATL